MPSGRKVRGAGRGSCPHGPSTWVERTTPPPSQGSSGGRKGRRVAGSAGRPLRDRSNDPAGDEEDLEVWAAAHDAAIHNLCEMGFAISKVRQALEAHEYNEDMALEELLLGCC